MKILLLLTSAFSQLGGIHTFNRVLLHSLDRSEVTTTALLLNDDAAATGSAEYVDPLRIRCIGFGANKLKFSLAAIRHSFAADVIIIGHVNLVPLALFMGGRRRLLIVHGVEVWRKLSALVRIALKRIDGFVSVSAYTRDKMSEINGVRPEKFSILPNSLDPHYPSSAGAPDLDFPQGRIILCVTRLDAEERYKNVELLIRAMPAVLERVPDSLLFIVGDGKDRPRLEQIANQSGAAARIIFAGRLPDPDLALAYSYCELFALPSTGEGFGIVYLEAMYYAKPCIGARAGAVPEVIEDGVTGHLVPVDSPAPLAEAVLKLLADPAAAARMGAAGRQRLEREFSLQRYRERLVALLALHPATR